MVVHAWAGVNNVAQAIQAQRFVAQLWKSQFPARILSAFALLLSGVACVHT